MFSIEVEFLTGRYAATAHNDRYSPEWPPHPARFFSALVAALHDREPVDRIEREALLWLESQPPPALNVDLSIGVSSREVKDVYVPVNDVTLVGDPEGALRDAKARGEDDRVLRKEQKRFSEFLESLALTEPKPSKKAIETAEALLPPTRTRQVRTFPVVFPSDPCFRFIWDQDPDPQVREALGRLCDRVTRLGHSSSLVRCALVEGEVRATLIPSPEGPIVLRAVGPGQCERLEREHSRHRALESRVLPSRPQAYRHAGQTGGSVASALRSRFSDDWVLFERVGGARILSSRGPELAKALRAALLEQAGSRPVPPAISGHLPDGTPLQESHLAIAALPFVGHEHADGAVQGIALIPPRELTASDREFLCRLVASWEKTRSSDGILDLAGPSLPAVRLRRVEVSAKATLNPAIWCRPSTRFVTATPIALDRNPGNLRSNRDGAAARAAREAKEIIGTACERVGLPKPVSVEVHLTPLVAGAQPVHAFLPWPNRPGRTARVRVHAELAFDRPVKGPLLIGAGRYFGLGLCLPL